MKRLNNGFTILHFMWLYDMRGNFNSSSWCSEVSLVTACSLSNLQYSAAQQSVILSELPPLTGKSFERG